MESPTHQPQAAKAPGAAAHQQGAKGLSRPAVPAVAQLERKREEEEPAQLMAGGLPAQLKVAASVPDRTRIIIDDDNAPDFGDTGTIIRHSRIQAAGKVVEFDNDQGSYYRVGLDEMSVFQSFQLAQPVDITANIDVEGGTADFEVFSDNEKIGDLRMQANDETLYILQIHTNLSEREPKQQVKGLGALLLYIASMLAKKWAKNKLSLSAQKQSDTHSATFYSKFKFESTDPNVSTAAADIFGQTFDEFLEEAGNPIVNMDGNTDTVHDETDQYLTRNGW